MDVDTASELARQGLYILLTVAAPAMVTGLLVGLTISLIQSITSIQEQTLSFVPKIMVTLGVVILTMPWVMTTMVEYTRQLYSDIPMRLLAGG